jgi:hypothetical protein
VAAVASLGEANTGQPLAVCFSVGAVGWLVSWLVGPLDWMIASRRAKWAAAWLDHDRVVARKVWRHLSSEHRGTCGHAYPHQHTIMESLHPSYPLLDGILCLEVQLGCSITCTHRCLTFLSVAAIHPCPIPAWISGARLLPCCGRRLQSTFAAGRRNRPTLCIQDEWAVSPQLPDCLRLNRARAF